LTPLSDAIRQQVQNDPTRPRYHFCAPVGWMNDPNGTIFHRGYYHVFYQWNPYGDTWAHIHWGHARSRDLITWEHLPVTLKPDSELGEEHCFSGCLTLRENQPPLILYTAIGPQMKVLESAQQWAAVGDSELIAWQKHPRNPILTTRRHGNVEVLDWRDPFVFEANKRTFLLLGGKLATKDAPAAVVLLYEAQDATLEQWVYRGILFRHPDLTRPSVECANIFKSGTQWVLLLSTHRQVEYYIGDFDADAGRFHAQTAGLLDGSDQFYATNLLRDAQQRQICFGWIRGFAPNRGWNGCLALPRVLWLDAYGCLCQRPVPEVNRLHAAAYHAAEIPLTTYALADFQGDALDLQARLTCEPQATCGIHLTPDDEQAEPIVFTCTPQEIRLNDKWLPFQREAEAEVDLRMFLDRSVVEVFINSQASLTLVLQPPVSSYRVELFAENGRATLRQLDVWTMMNPGRP
jgi:beta-fructofuranosidase